MVARLNWHILTPTVSSYLIETKNINDDMAESIDAFVTSDYPKTHPLHSKENVKTLGKFKDECSSLQPYEFITDFEARCIP